MSKKAPVEPGKSTREKVFDFLVTYKREHNGDSPSNRDIAQACCLSISTVNYHLLKLELENRIQVLGRRRIHIVGGAWDLPSDASEAEKAIDEMNGDSSVSEHSLWAQNAGGMMRSDSEPGHRKDAADSPHAEDSAAPP